MPAVENKSGRKTLCRSLSAHTFLVKTKVERLSSRGSRGISSVILPFFLQPNRSPAIQSRLNVIKPFNLLIRILNVSFLHSFRFPSILLNCVHITEPPFHPWLKEKDGRSRRETSSMWRLYLVLSFQFHSIYPVFAIRRTKYSHTNSVCPVPVSLFSSRQNTASLSSPRNLCPQEAWLCIPKFWKNIMLLLVEDFVIVFDTRCQGKAIYTLPV